MTNMTYVDALDIAIAAVTDDVAIEKLTALKAQLVKRKTSKKPTKTQQENELIMEQIALDLAEFEEPVTVTELITQGDGLDGLTNQKVSALLRKMIEADRVVKIMDGKKAKFALA
jgi:hypothetical protein